MITPEPVRSLLQSFESSVTRPTFARLSFLFLAAILTTGRKTISNFLRTMACLGILGHPTSYHRVFSKRRWQPWRLSLALTSLILKVFYPDAREVICLAGDDTVDGHKGKHVFGKSRHRDAVRSSHSFMAYRYGHKWVVISILVRVPWSPKRKWALPCLVALYQSSAVNQAQGRRHKTPPDLMHQMLIWLLRSFPSRKFLFCADQGFALHRIARLAAGSGGRLIMVSRFYLDACLYEPAPVDQHHVGRPRKRGKHLPSPCDVVQASRRRKKYEVSWYGGGVRKIASVTGTGHWHKAGHGLVHVRWVYVEDLSGTHRPEYFFTTDVAMNESSIIETYTSRWSLEVTFEEMREYVGLETTKGWSPQTILRMAPSLFGLYSLVVLLYESLPSRYKDRVFIDWTEKDHLTFSDVMTSVRRYLWQEWIFANLPGNEAVAKLPTKLRCSLLSALAPAA